MKIAVFGLGNVGLVASLALCEQGHDVFGIDINADKIGQLQNGRIYLYEDRLQELLETHKNRFKPFAAAEALRNIDCFMICVGSPAMSDGGVNLDQVVATTRQISRLLVSNPDATVILRSTVPPGTAEETVIPLLDQSGAPYSFIYHPEFLREGSAVKDFLEPNLHVIGLVNPESEPSCMELFRNADRLMKVPIRTAEMLKYLNNGYHALKVVFANELASLASAMSVPIEPLFEAFFADSKLNISSAYLRPGFSFGGPCLTKELSALQQLSRSHKVETPLLATISLSNEAHLRRSLEKIERMKPQKIVVFGVSYKSGTDDVRSSPMLLLIHLLGRRPSYLPTREIWVSDLAGALEKMKTLSICAFDEIPPITPDCIIMGSTRLSDVQIDWIRKQKCKVFDMCLTTTPTQLDDLDLVRPYEA